MFLSGNFKCAYESSESFPSSPFWIVIYLAIPNPDKGVSKLLVLVILHIRLSNWVPAEGKIVLVATIRVVEGVAFSHFDTLVGGVEEGNIDVDRALENC